MRERFTRELRKSYLEPNNSVKYEYFKDLSFLSPYIKFRSISFESADGKTIVTKREDISMEKDHSTVEELKMMDQDAYFSEEQEHTYLQEPGGSQNIIYESTTIEHVPEFSGSSHAIHEVVQQSDEESPLSVKPKERKRKYTSWEECEDQDKYFAMSVACSLKGLSTINNCRAKAEIFKVLGEFTSKQEKEKQWKCLTTDSMKVHMGKDKQHIFHARFEAETTYH